MTKETNFAEEFMKGVLERERLSKLGKKIEKLAAEKGIFRLTETRDRSRCGDTWTETTTDWSAVARLFEALNVEIDTK